MGSAPPPDIQIAPTVALFDLLTRWEELRRPIAFQHTPRHKATRFRMTGAGKRMRLAESHITEFGCDLRSRLRLNGASRNHRLKEEFFDLVKHNLMASGGGHLSGVESRW